MSDAVDDLLAQLCSGDLAAAEHFFLAYEPYLRKAVRRHLTAPLRAKFDSADIVQSVLADVFRGFREAGCRFIDADHLRGFLFVATRNRLIDRIRQHQKAVDREEPLAVGEREQQLPCPQPRPSEFAEAGEMWQRIVARCPAAHRPIVELKRHGHSLAEIAEQTGLHPDSIRRILRTLARQLAFEQGPSGAEAQLHGRLAP